MKRLVVVCLAVAACGAPPSETPAPTIVLEPGQSSLRVTVARQKVGKGPLFCDLFNSGEGFPGPSPIVGGSQQHAASDTVTCTWADLPAGRYAVSVIQDENDNGTLDMNVFGVPTEGYGVSNNVIPATSAPRWDDAVVRVEPAAALELTVALQN